MPKEDNQKDTQKLDDPNVVDHLRHPLALVIRDLLVKEKRRALAQIIIDDEENILQAIKAKVSITQLFAVDRESLSQELINQLPKDCALIDVSKRTAKKIFGTDKASRVFAIADEPAPVPADMLKSIERDCIALDNLSISGNVGAIIRTAAAFKTGAIVLLDSDAMDIYDRRIIRASRGMVFHVPVITLASDDFITLCKDNNIKLCVTSSHTDLSIDDALKGQDKLAILFGSEKEGCQEKLTQAADIKAKIDIDPSVESLNVSAAASIVMYLAAKRNSACG